MANSPIYTNAWVAYTNVSRVFSITAQNSSAGDLWLHVFDTNAVPANNTIPTLAPVKVPAGETWGYDFADVGCPFYRGVTVCNSTTDRTLTNSSANFKITVTYYERSL